MADLARKQDELMEQARFQEEKQMSFRREIRNQLDDAVLALRETHKVLVEETDRIAKLPVMPLTRPEVSMEASLTGQMMGTTRATVTAELGKMLVDGLPRLSIAEELRQPSKVPVGVAPGESTPRPPAESAPPTPSEQAPPIVMSEELRREMQQDHIMGLLKDEGDEEEEEKLIVKPVLTRSQANEQVMRHARQLVSGSRGSTTSLFGRPICELPLSAPNL
jgi:hypothetical protein